MSADRAPEERRRALREDLLRKGDRIAGDMERELQAPDGRELRLPRAEALRPDEILVADAPQVLPPVGPPSLIAFEQSRDVAVEAIIVVDEHRDRIRAEDHRVDALLGGHLLHEAAQQMVFALPRNVVGKGYDRVAGITVDENDHRFQQGIDERPDLPVLVGDVVHAHMLQIVIPAADEPPGHVRHAVLRRTLEPHRLEACGQQMGPAFRHAVDEDRPLFIKVVGPGSEDVDIARAAQLHEQAGQACGIVAIDDEAPPRRRLAVLRQERGEHAAPHRR